MKSPFVLDFKVRNQNLDANYRNMPFIVAQLSPHIHELQLVKFSCNNIGSFLYHHRIEGVYSEHAEQE